MMGQGLTPVTSVKTGNIVAIRGLSQHILKTATLSSTVNCWPFSSIVFQVVPMLKVAIEPSEPADAGALMKGLCVLNRADPFVEVTVSAREEHVLAAAEEVHLERCVKDLKKRFAKVNLEVSASLISFKETIEGNVLENLKWFSGSSDYVEKTTVNGRCDVRVQVMKLPFPLTKLLNESSELLGYIIGGKSKQALKSLETSRGVITEDENPIEALKKRMMDAVESDLSFEIAEMERGRVEKYRTMWKDIFERIWAMVPRQVGPNILLTPARGKKLEGSVLIMGFPYVSQKLGLADKSDASTESSSSITDEMLLREAESLESGVLSRFQIATSAGSFCDEPMWGLAFIVEAFISPVEDNDNDNTPHQVEPYEVFTGQVMTAVKDACRAAVLQRKPRLVEVLYFCELNTPTEHLGLMYTVHARRRARVLKEKMQEGSLLFTIHAYVSVLESFGFADELRRWTFGAASALLVLSHWETLDEHPFFMPKTEEETEEYGDGYSVVQNTARKLVDDVRR